jgi:putative nucleotidyltransferase with HDIG domain
MKVIPLPGRIPGRATVWLSLQNKSRWMLGALLALLLTVLMATRVMPDKVTLQIGQTAPDDIRAERSVRYISHVATRQARESAAERVPAQYVDDSRALSTATDSVSAVFLALRNSRSAGGSDNIAKRIADARTRLELAAPSATLSDTAIRTALRSSDSTLEDLEQRTLQVVRQVMETDIRDDNANLNLARKKAAGLVAAMRLFPGPAALVDEVARACIRPNRVQSPLRTEQAREAASAGVAPVERTIQRDEVFVRKGAVISEEDVEKFEALGLQRPGLDFGRLAALFLFLGIVLFAVSSYLRLYEPEVYADPSKLLLLSLLVAISVSGLKIGNSMLGVQLSTAQLGYLSILWIVLPALLAAALLNPSIAFLLSALLSITAGVTWELEPRFIAIATVGALAAIYGVSRIRDRGDLLRIAGLVAAATVSLVWILGKLAGDSTSQLLMGTWWTLGSGLGAAVLFWIGVALFERPFGLVTHIGLLELCDLNRELLRRLQWEAPGTYHHCLGVANLAEAGAEAIGADGLLVRVAAYYHDIGKIRRPQYFVENQDADNVHDHLSPSLSKVAITAHVRDGLELARQYRLPPQVTAGITQHHGTSLISFFYHQATGGEDQNGDLQQQFRYEGPKPQTREMAILMIADSVEAASRATSKPTPQKLEQVIDDIIQAKLNDGQFDECDLTFRDIVLARDAFVRVLVSMLHSRIVYPGQTDTDGDQTNGTDDTQNEAGASPVEVAERGVGPHTDS